MPPAEGLLIIKMCPRQTFTTHPTFTPLALPGTGQFQSLAVFVLGLKRPSFSSLLGQADLQGSPQVNDSYPASLCIEPSVQGPLAFLTSDLQTAQAEVKGP